MHLPGKAHVRNALELVPYAEGRERAAKAIPPVFGVLFAPMLMRVADGVFRALLAKDMPLAIRKQQLYGTCAKVHAKKHNGLLKRTVCR